MWRLTKIFSCRIFPKLRYSFCVFSQKMIVEQSANKKPLATNLSHNFIKVEENAIYYISGYVIKETVQNTFWRGNRIFGEGNTQFSW